MSLNPESQPDSFVDTRSYVPDLNSLGNDYLQAMHRTLAYHGHSAEVDQHEQRFAVAVDTAHGQHVVRMAVPIPHLELVTDAALAQLAVRYGSSAPSGYAALVRYGSSTRNGFDAALACGYFIERQSDEAASESELDQLASWLEPLIANASREDAAEPFQRQLWRMGADDMSVSKMKKGLRLAAGVAVVVAVSLAHLFTGRLTPGDDRLSILQVLCIIALGLLFALPFLAAKTESKGTIDGHGDVDGGLTTPYVLGVIVVAIFVVGGLLLVNTRDSCDESTGECTENEALRHEDVP